MCGDVHINVSCHVDPVGTFVQPMLIFCTMILIITGNFLTMMVIVRERKLHTITFVCVFNLSLTDFLLGLITQPLSFYYSISCHWLGGPDGFLCQFTGFSICVLCSVSILSLGLISAERYLYIVHPFTHHNVKINHVLLSCFLIWTCGIIASVFPVAGLWKGVGLQPYNALCNIQWQIEPIYLVCMIVFVVLPAFGMIVITYAKILKLAVKARKSRMKVDVTSENATRKETDADGNKPMSVLRQYIAKKKSNITVTLLIGTFTVCWTPYVLATCVQAIRCEVNPFWVNAISQWLCIFNSGCNPVVYGLTNRNFREGVKKLFRLRRGDDRALSISFIRDD